MSERLTQLQKMLQREPNDAFLLYAIALEYKKSSEWDRALEHLAKVTQVDPGYCYAYHQAGLIHEAHNDIPAARAAYREGITAATKKGDAHAGQEIAGALAMIE